MFKLTLRTTSPVPLEVHGITPAAVTKLSALEVAKLPVQHGNRREEIGQFFDVAAASAVNVVFGAHLHFAGDTRNVHGIGAGMTEGFVYVENDAGRHAGAQMSGGTLIIDSGASDWLGAEMRGGSIEVRHSAGHQVGAAYRGSRRGMRGGDIRIRGDAGDELGLLMRRGIIRVDGRAGQFAGASMIAGTLLLLGGAGGRLGAGMKRGTIVTRGPAEVPESFRFACRIRPTFLGLYRKHSEDLPASFGREEMDCYRGDLLAGGHGEVFFVGRPS